MGRNYHVVIIGGGFAGLAAADLLARHKLTVLVVDDFESYSNTSPDRPFQAWLDGFGHGGQR